MAKSSNTLKIECGHLWKCISKYWYFHKMVWLDTQMLHWCSSEKIWMIYFLDIIAFSLSIYIIFSEYYCQEYFSINNILQYPVWAQTLWQWLITLAPTVNEVDLDMCIFHVSPDYLPSCYAICIYRVICEVVMSSQLTERLQLAALRHPVIVTLSHQR